MDQDPSERPYRHRCLMTHPVCQQELRACNPMFEQHPFPFFLAVGILHLIIAGVVFGCAFQVKEYTQRYDNLCTNETSTVTLTFDLGSTLSPPVYIYYELLGFYQNHFRFANSYSQDQMLGRYVEDAESCKPMRYSPYTNNTDLVAPCGLMAVYFFNDSYDVVSGGVFNEDDINWDGEKGNLFKPLSDEYSDEQRWMKNMTRFPGEIQNPHFISWMRVANSPNFRKLWAKATTDVGPTVEIDVSCNYPSFMFRGERRLVLLKPGGLGGHNWFLAYLNLVLGVVCVVLALWLRFVKCSCVRKSKRSQWLLEDIESMESNAAIAL